jgi:alpha-L-fucosidase
MYEPTMASLRQHTVPAWYAGAKLGIFIHWTPATIPAWAPLTGEYSQIMAKRGPAYFFANNPYVEWYQNCLRIAGSPTHQHHLAEFGPNYPYENFVPQFRQTSQRLDANAWADLFARAGARYAVLVTKHHDGYLLWPSRQPNPFHPGYQSECDLVGDVTTAVRSRGLRMGLYYSGGLDWTFTREPIRDLMSMLAAVPDTPEYSAYADGHYHELIERYHPDVLWNDIAYPPGSDLKRLFADYYNAVPDGVINDRWGQTRLPRGRAARAALAALIGLLWRLLARAGNMPTANHHDFTTPEYASYQKIVARKWESTRGFGYSFGYNREERPEHVLTAEALIHSFIDIVSKNGNLLINVGPMADGTIPPIQAERLLALGGWLKVNGEAIYDTAPWTRPEGRATDAQTGKALDVRFTAKGGAVYAILLGMPRGREITIDGLSVQPGDRVTLLGCDAPLSWRQNGSALAVTLPEGLPDAVAHTVKIEKMI